MNNTIKEIATEHKKYIDEFLSYIKRPLISAEKMSGGTQSFVYLINNKYIMKINAKEKLKLEYLYFMAYGNNNPLMQKMIYCEKDCNYIVYNYVKGKHIENVKNPKLLNKKIIKFIKKYKKYPHFGFGDIHQPHPTWEKFLMHLYTDSIVYLSKVLSQEQIGFVLSEIPKLSQYNFTKKLLHGDLRLNNFICDNGKFAGIIDPYPMIGDTLYDLLFFVFSVPEITSLYNINLLHKKFKQPFEKVKILSMIVISVKIKRIIKYEADMHLLNHFTNLLNEVSNMSA